MTQCESLGGESYEVKPSRSACDLRHPADLDIEAEARAIKRQQRAGLAVGYMLAHQAMEDFFAAGHPRPEHGDESY